MHKITISAEANGYTVEVGCKKLVFNDRKLMLKEIGRYLVKPVEVEKEYLDNEKIFKPDNKEYHCGPLTGIDVTSSNEGVGGCFAV